MVRRSVEDTNTNDSEFSALATIVKKAHEEGVTMEEAERLAARFLSAQMAVAEELARVDLDSRMSKNGLRATKAAVYMACVKANDKKPAEAYLENHVNLDPMVGDAQTRYDELDSRKESLSIYMGIFKDAHVYFRAIMRGTYSA